MLSGQVCKSAGNTPQYIHILRISVVLGGNVEVRATAGGSMFPGPSLFGVSEQRRSLSNPARAVRTACGAAFSMLSLRKV
jgi:hypothetical protein